MHRCWPVHGGVCVFCRVLYFSVSRAHLRCIVYVYWEVLARSSSLKKRDARRALGRDGKIAPRHGPRANKKELSPYTYETLTELT